MARAGLGLARGRLAYVRKIVATARALCGEEAQQARLPRARHAARVGIGAPTLEGRRASDRALSFAARPWCHAPALVQHAAGLRMCARAAIALALCWEEAQHAR